MKRESWTERERERARERESESDIYIYIKRERERERETERQIEGLGGREVWSGLKFSRGVPDLEEDGWGVVLA